MAITIIRAVSRRIMGIATFSGRNADVQNRGRMAAIA